MHIWVSRWVPICRCIFSIYSWLVLYNFYVSIVTCNFVCIVCENIANRCNIHARWICNIFSITHAKFSRICPIFWVHNSSLIFFRWRTKTTVFHISGVLRILFLYIAFVRIWPTFLYFLYNRIYCQKNTRTINRIV